jgi:hypothetical protein
MLLGSRVELVDESEFGKPFAFGLTENEASRRYIFVAASELERRQWMVSLADCSSMKGAMARINPAVLQTAAKQFGANAHDDAASVVKRSKDGANTGMLPFD